MQEKEILRRVLVVFYSRFRHLIVQISHHSQDVENFFFKLLVGFNKNEVHMINDDLVKMCF